MVDAPPRGYREVACRHVRRDVAVPTDEPVSGADGIVGRADGAAVVRGDAVNLRASDGIERYGVLVDPPGCCQSEVLRRHRFGERYVPSSERETGEEGIRRTFQFGTVGGGHLTDRGTACGVEGYRVGVYRPRSGERDIAVGKGALGHGVPSREGIARTGWIVWHNYLRPVILCGCTYRSPVSVEERHRVPVDLPHGIEYEVLVGERPRDVRIPPDERVARKGRIVWYGYDGTVILFDKGGIAAVAEVEGHCVPMYCP